MSRPKKGTKAGDIATEKWRATMLAKYGSAEELHKAMQKMGQKGGKNGHTGGFAANPGLARLAGAKGGKRSRRGPAKRDAQGRAVNKDGTLHGKNGSHMRVRANDISEKSNILDAAPLTFEEQKIQRGNLFKKFFGRNK